MTSVLQFLPIVHGKEQMSQVPKPIRIVVSSSKTYTIGRSKECDIHITSPTVNSKHAELRITEDGHVLIRSLCGGATCIDTKIQLLASQEKELQQGHFIKFGKDVPGTYAVRQAIRWRMFILQPNSTCSVLEKDLAESDHALRCTICLDDLGCNHHCLTRLGCGHIMHSACVREMANTTGGGHIVKCPLCRQLSDIDPSTN